MGNFCSVLSDACHSVVSIMSFAGPRGHPTSIEVKGARYRVDRLIAEGGYSFVYAATDKVGGSKVALKRFAIQDAEEQSRLMEEVRTQRDLCPHDNIVLLFDSEIKQVRGKPLPEFWISMEFVAGPSLQTLVNSRKLSGKPTLRSEVIAVLCDVASALAHMHSQSPPVAHWDVKLDNVLQADKYKLCDFGSASKCFYECRTPQEISVAEVELNAKMTLLYRPPESLDLWRKQRVDTKADIWSFGVLVYTLVLQEMPFEENPLDILLGKPKLLRGKSDDTFAIGHSSNIFPVEFQDVMHLVMTCMLVPNPSERQDIFFVCEKLTQLNASFVPPSRPRPGFVSAQKGRFA